MRLISGFSSCAARLRIDLMRSLRCSALRPDLGHLDRRISRRGFSAEPLGHQRCGDVRKDVGDLVAHGEQDHDHDEADQDEHRRKAHHQPDRQPRTRTRAWGRRRPRRRLGRDPGLAVPTPEAIRGQGRPPLGAIPPPEAIRRESCRRGRRSRPWGLPDHAGQYRAMPKNLESRHR